MNQITKNNLLRVTQMNAVYLDNEIYKTFLQVLKDASRYLPPGMTAPYEPEINLFLQLAIIKYSIFNNGTTFGQEMLSIKYKDISYIKKILYTTACCSSYIRTKLEVWKPSHEINNMIFNMYTVIKFLDFINLSVFLRNGEKPLLIERILGLRQEYASEIGHRQYETKYLARELLWNGFIEVLVYILPLINYHKIKRTVRNYNPLCKKPIYTVMSNRATTVHSKCAYCGENPILPHHMGCAHIFCYVCLKGNQAADSRYECPMCEHRNPNLLCDRVTVLS